MKVRSTPRWHRKMRRKLRLWSDGIALQARGLKPAHFLHIYKTGGTALKHALAHGHSNQGFLIRCHKHSITLDCIPQGHKVVFFLRDPVARFVSGFYDRQRQGRPRYNTPWSDQEACTFARFATPNQLGEALASAGAELEAAEAALASLDRIRKPLSDWLGDRDYFLSRLGDILFVGRQERLAEDFDRLKQLIGLPTELRLPVDDVSAHRASNVDKRLSPAARNALRQRYAHDYAYLQMLQDCGLLAPASSPANEVDQHSPVARRFLG